MNRTVVSSNPYCLSVIISLFGLLYSGDSHAKAKVYHLDQNHGSFELRLDAEILLQFQSNPELAVDGIDENKFVNDFRAAYDSQKQAYQWLDQKITQNSEVIVRVEGSSALPTEQECHKIQSKFGSLKIEAPSIEQMLLIVTQGPSKIFYCSGRLKNFRPGEDDQLNSQASLEMAKAQMDKKYGYASGNNLSSSIPLLFHSIFGAREQWLADQVLSDLGVEQETEVVIFYGAAHDLKKWFPNIDFERVDTTKASNGGISYNPEMEFGFAKNVFKKKTKEFKQICEESLHQYFTLGLNGRLLQKINDSQGIGQSETERRRARYEYALLSYKSGMGVSLEEVNQIYFLYKIIEFGIACSTEESFVEMLRPIYCPF